MKKIIYLLLIVLFAMPVFAKKVDLEMAKFAAKNLYFLRINQFQDVKLADINLTLAYTETANNEPVYYVFNVNETEGFVIISADDIARPCIGYSFEGPFSANQAPSFQFWMNGYKTQIAEGVSRKATASAEAIDEWAKLLTETPVLVKSKSIQPLLLTTWNQDWPYNELCPVDAAGPGGHVYVGCVATSMIQVMKYWNYPDMGSGSHTVPSYINPNYGALTVNFAAQTYVWENMTNSVTGSNLEIAKIGYHAGVGVNMAYAADGSGTQTSYVPSALETYFKYHTDAQYIQKSSYSSTWEDIIMAQIDLKRPTIYSGSDPAGGGGHAWNCDGYQTGSPNTFHMNWGWGGSSNGFYAIDNLIAGGYDFTATNALVRDIHPVSNYPEGCTTTAKMITGDAGTFNDGSGNTNYSDNLDCLYLIQPLCSSVINVTFDRFNLGTGDVVYVYDGTTIAAPLIATYNATTLPTAAISTYNGAMLLRFVTDASNNAEGWYVSYATSPCQSVRNVTDLSGTITDGSLSCDYGNSLVCRWDIAPAGANATTWYHLTFPDFNFATGDAGDYLKIYKNTVSTANVIGTYNAITPPPAQLDINGTKVILKFQTNSTSSSSGWTVNYSTILTGMENNLAEFGASLYPNPFNNDATISYTLIEPTNVKITVTNILGKQIGNYEQSNVQGAQNLQLSSFVDEITQGIYFVNLSFNDKSTLIKIICTK